MRKNKAFTLIELLIVLIVVGVLTVITIIVYNGAKFKANYTKAVDDMKKVEDAARLYLADKETWPTGTTNWVTETALKGGIPKPPCKDWTYEWISASSPAELVYLSLKQPASGTAGSTPVARYHNCISGTCKTNTVISPTITDYYIQNVTDKSIDCKFITPPAP